MESTNDIISDEEIDKVHANASFGEMSRRQVVDQGILKCASGFHQGYTSTRILREHGLITADYELTHKGQNYLWAAFRQPDSV